MTKLRYVILFVSDMERSVAFYRDVLGWPLKCQSPERTAFATEETTLALLCASKPSGAAAVQGDLAGRCQLGLWVDDVLAFHQDGGPEKQEGHLPGQQARPGRQWKARSCSGEGRIAEASTSSTCCGITGSFCACRNSYPSVTGINKKEQDLQYERIQPLHIHSPLPRR